MKLKILALVLLNLCFTFVEAQTTSVTATVTDSDSTIWINPQWSVQFVPNPNFPQLSSYSIGGVPITSNTYKQYIQVSGTGNGSGVISTTLLDNNQVLPAGSKYRWVVQSQTSAPATTYLPITVTGGSQSLTSYLSTNSIAPRFSALFNAFGYADVEISVLPPPGGTYWNTASATQRVWNGSSWIAGGGGGACGTNNIPCTNTANTYTGIQSAPGFAGTGSTQTVLNETAGTAAAAPPVNTIQRGAPLSIPNSYNLYDPSVAPPDATGDVEVWPQGGGTSTWSAPPAQVLIEKQTLGSSNTTVTFSGIPQTFNTLALVIHASNTGNTASFGKINVNGDATAGHYFVSYYQITFGNTPSSSGSFSNAGLFIPSNDSTTTFYGYTGSAGFNIVSMGANAGGLLIANDVWAGAAPMTSMAITTSNADTFLAGSTFSLYGVN